LALGGVKQFILSKQCILSNGDVSPASEFSRWLFLWCLPATLLRTVASFLAIADSLRDEVASAALFT
jgi:hypothetical protein